MQLAADFFGNNVHHAAGRARAVAGGGGAAQHGDGFDVFRRHPVAVAARVALAAPTVTLGVARGNGAAVDQNQRVFRPHAANVDLAFVAALAGGGVAGEVHARHGAHDVGNVVHRRTGFQILGGDFRHAQRLLKLALRGYVNGFKLAAFAGGFVGGLRERAREGERQHGQGIEGCFAGHCSLSFVKIFLHNKGGI